jgi:plasmid replication initiation protein
MLITNKDVIQSYILTVAKYDFNVYEKRILYRLVEIAQMELEGKKLNSGFRIDKLLFDEMREVTMPISAFLKDEEDENYTRVKESLKRLRNKTFEYSTHEKQWKLIGLIEMPEFNNGYAKFKVHREVYEAMLNFSKGFRKYELKTAMTFESAYTMRFYELFADKKDPITYTIDNLKIMFGLEKKYKQTGDFLIYVVDVAKRELDAKAPYSFTYTKNCKGKKILSLKFHPFNIPANRDENLEHKELQKHIALSWDINKMVVDYLMQNYLFDREGIKNNMETFKDANKYLDLMDFMSKKKRKANDSPSPQGYLIKALKGEIAKAKGEKQTEKNAPADTPVDANIKKRVLESMAKIGKI